MPDPKPIFYDVCTPYKVVNTEPIQYTVCRDYSQISRYRGLRQIIHESNSANRWVALEVPNPITTNSKFDIFDVPRTLENRLDVIAAQFYGSASYSWVIAYHNDIEDGFTVREGQKLRILKNFSDLFEKGEILAPIPALSLNLGIE